MILLVCGSTKTINNILPHKFLGKYISPAHHSYPIALKKIEQQRCIWGTDNDCFICFNERQYIKMIERLPRIDTLKYVTLPDVVGNHEETSKLFNDWQIKFKNEKLPLAFVLQDGCTVKDVPFDKIKAIFIGGSTEYKLSKTVRDIITIASAKNKWVHMGRVNSIERIVYAYNIGCNSFDGSSFSMFANTLVPSTLRLLNNLQNQLCLV